MITASMLPLLGVSVAEGRGFGDADDRAGAEGVALLSAAFARRRFPTGTAVGQAVQLDGKPYTVVGVLPSRFELFQPADVYVPFWPWASALPEDRGWHPGILPVARLRPGVTLEQARSEMQTIAQQLEAEHQDSNKNVRVLVTRAQDQVVQNIDGRQSRYKTFEVSMNKRYADRWSAQAGYSFTWLNDFITTAPNSFPQTPNLPGLQDRTTWSLKFSGSYDAAWGIRISPILRHQSGGNFARTISVPASAGNALGLIVPTQTIYADLPGDNRQDNIWVFDTRLEKTFELSSRTRLRGFVDFFNITNSSAAETITASTGANYLRPAAILAPFTTRLGVRFLW